MFKIALKRLSIFSVIVAGVALLFLVATNNTQAQENQSGNGLRISPVRQELTLSPGQNDSFTIEVTNVTTGPTTVSTIVNDFESDDETGQPRLLTTPDPDNPFTLRNFVDLPGDFELGPGESQNVTISVRLPSDLAPGGYFGAVRFDAGVGGVSGDSTVALSASVASLLLVNVPGQATEQLDLDFIRAKKGDVTGTFFESAPEFIEIGLNNTGNTILKPFGRVAIKDIFGNEVHDYEFNGSQLRGNVLPQSSRIFSDEVDGVGFIGKYTVEINLGYGEGGGNIITASSSFWVIPWRILLVAIALLAGLIWFMTRGIKIYNRKVVERAKKNS